MEFYVNVVLPIPLERLFTYSITEEEASFLQPGMRIAVPFGKSKIYTGLVHQIHQTAPTAYEAKPIHQILDEIPLVYSVQLEHWQWIAQYYMCTLGEVFRAAVPGAFLLESETLILRNEEIVVDEDELKDDEFLVLEALRHQKELRVAQISDIVDKKTILPLLNRLLNTNAILVKEQLYEQYKPKWVKYVKLTEEYETDTALEALLETLSRAPKQRAAILTLFQLQSGINKPIKKSSLEKEGNLTSATVGALVKKGVLEEHLVRTDRVSYTGKAENDPFKELTEEQQNAKEQIEHFFDQKKVVLLHGVTSSGKTEVYFRLIARCLEQGKQALYLLPEIALTTQLIQRLQRQFGNKVAVFHSRYTAHERVEVWNNVLNKEQKARVVIGARSALFLPFSNLGLIVVDEEHENSFKQFDPAPRYHARDAAVVLAKLHEANVVLGSATPSIESYHNAKLGKYGVTTLTRRYGEVQMPEVELVDLKEQHKKRRMKGHFSERLLEELSTTFLLKKQAILFQNRRGYAPIVECTSCGHSPQCPNCDVSLTYHQFKKQLRCHYCGHHINQPVNCAACGNPTLDTKGFGTEQVEEELQLLFPEARVGRMDFDTTRGKHSYARIIQRFENQEYDVLVGTQMVTKGLDFRNVQLVGIMNADSLLNFPDFRAHERSFQLLTQVAGRAGRTKERGKVIIQTYNPYHQILQQVTTAAFEELYEQQLYEREQYGYPPVTRIIKITFKHKDYNTLNEAAAWFATALRNVFTAGVLGPEFPPVSRIRNQYLKNVLVKIAKPQSITKTKNSIKRIETSFNAISQYRAVRVIYNVDYF